MAVLMMDPMAQCESFLAQLEEEDARLQTLALRKLVDMVDHCWHIISDKIETIETLYEDENFPERERAAFLASKVYFHLQEINDALTYALSSGSLFDINSDTEFVQTIITECIDKYQECQQHNAVCAENEHMEINSDLKRVVEAMLDRCFTDNYSRQALGIALESLRIDYLERAICAENNSAEILGYTFELCKNIESKRFREQVYNLLLNKYRELMSEDTSVDYRNVCKCLYHLDSPEEVGSILMELINNDTRDGLLYAYQTAFDIAAYEDDGFLRKVAEVILPTPVVIPVEEETGTKPVAEEPVAENATGTEEQAENNNNVNNAEEEQAMNVDPVVPEMEEIPQDDPRKRLVSILDGSFSEETHMVVLHQRNHTDFVILKNIKDNVPASKGSLNMTVAAANSIMNCGTTSDQFFRDNLKWLSKFRNFDKFLTTAFIGLIHKGHVTQGMKIYSSYLPEQAGPIAGGGALYGLGIIHANTCDQETRNYLLEYLGKSDDNEILKHGALLANGVINIGSGNQDLFATALDIVRTGDAIPGMAAGYCIGLTMTGVMIDEQIEECLLWAREVQSEKVIRSIVMALAMMCYAQEENAMPLIQKMSENRDFHLRYGACYAIGLAYAGTSNNRALRLLLDFAVSDVSEDVRRAATTAIGFVFANKPDEVPGLLRLLASSYNPHVRYGAACALGIACAGTANKKAYKLLKTLYEDNIDFVRNGASIALGLIFSHRNETECAEVKEINEKFKTTYTKKITATLHKMGVILGMGLMNAGGRNLTVSMMTESGQKRMKAIVGMSLFFQHWDWYPLIPFISLCFKPCLTIGINENFELPIQSFTCNTKPSLFAYPEFLKEETKKKKQLLKTTELSISAKAKARKAKKAKEKAEENGDVEMAEVAEEPKPEAMEVVDENQEKETVEEKPVSVKEEEEPTSFTLENPCRITPSQRNFVTLPEDAEWETVNKRELTGFILLRQRDTSKEAQFVQLKEANTSDLFGDEPKPPEDFIYTGPYN